MAYPPISSKANTAVYYKTEEGLTDIISVGGFALKWKFGPPGSRTAQ